MKRSLIMTVLLLTFALSACSNTKSNASSNVKEVQTGTVMALKIIKIAPKPIKPRGEMGVSIGSGGHSGVYGSVDLATIGGLFGAKKKEKRMQEIIVRRSNGSLVAITQPEVEPFFRGDKVKIVHRGNQARVIH